LIRKLLAVLLGAIGLVALTATAASAATEETWDDVATQMNVHLEEAWEAYLDGDVGAAKAAVDVAYYGYYEKLGFEAAVMGHVSGQSATDAEYEFGLIKKTMGNADGQDEVREHIDTLEELLIYQAGELDGAGTSAASTLFQALIIILREGFEAILVLGAIIAYLIKSGNADKLRTVYAGAILALVASGVLAVAMNAITALSGANAEITEGVTVLIAMVMLIWVSNWILSKAEAGAWADYIRTKTQASLGRGSVWSLAAVAFLAVFREGAETILLYQALRARAEDTVNMVWVGLAIGAVALVAVYLAIRFLSIKLPLRPFFLATSAVLAVLAFSFAGSGIKELQEGGVIPITPVNGIGAVDLLGIYPSVETLSAQGAALVAMVALAVYSVWRSHRRIAQPSTTQLETSK
jgi:high-affinity iron transporter